MHYDDLLPINQGLSDFAKTATQMFGPLNPNQQLGSTGMVVSDYRAILDMVRCLGEAIGAAGYDQPQKKTPQDIAIDALKLWRDGTWSKAQAMKVVQAALEEYRTHRTVYAQPVQPWRTALPPGMPAGDADLLDQLFR